MANVIQQLNKPTLVIAYNKTLQASSTASSRNLVKISEVRRLGTEALVKALGPIGMARNLEEYDNGGQGDYTKEKYEQPDYSSKDILAMVNQNFVQDLMKLWVAL